MRIDFDQLFAVKGAVATAKVPVLIPDLLWCRRGTRLKNVQIGAVSLVALVGHQVEVQEADGFLIIENFFPYPLANKS